jgi:hypothetical protein
MIIKSVCREIKRRNREPEWVEKKARLCELCTDALKAESVCELRKKEQSRRDELEN